MTDLSQRARSHCFLRMSLIGDSAAPRRRSARVALHAGAVSHQSVVLTLAAGVAFVALGLGFRALLARALLRGFLPLQMLERLRGRELLLGLGLQRDRAGGMERGDIARGARVGGG